MKWAAYHHAYIYCLQIFCCFFYVFCCDLSFSFSFLFLCHTTKRLLRPLVSAAPLHSRMSSRDQPTKCVHITYTHTFDDEKRPLNDPYVTHSSRIYTSILSTSSAASSNNTHNAYDVNYVMSRTKKKINSQMLYILACCACVWLIIIYYCASQNV